jgi:hypothetical protein
MFQWKYSSCIRKETKNLWKKYKSKLRQSSKDGEEMVDQRNCTFSTCLFYYFHYGKLFPSGFFPLIKIQWVLVSPRMFFSSHLFLDLSYSYDLFIMMNGILFLLTWLESHIIVSLNCIIKGMLKPANIYICFLNRKPKIQHSNIPGKHSNIRQFPKR